MTSEQLPSRSDVVYIARCAEHGLHGERASCFVCHGPVEQVEFVPAARLEAAEGERDRARKDVSDLTYKLANTRHQLAVMRGERDRLREAATKLLEGYWYDRLDAHEALQELDAALSTGDRQNDDLGVRTGVPTQPGIAGTDDEGGG